MPTLYSGFIWDDIQFFSLPLKMGETPYKYFLGWGVYYRPFIHVVNTFDYSMWHLSPVGWHITNIITNIFNALLVFAFSFYLLKYKSMGNNQNSPIEPNDVAIEPFGSARSSSLPNGPWHLREQQTCVESNEVKQLYIMSFFTALLFTLNPLHVESVAWISGRTDMLCTLMIIPAFLAFTAYITNKNSVALVLASLFFLFALFSKESALSFIMITFVFGLIIKSSKKHYIYSMLTFFAVTFIYFFVLRKGGGLRELTQAPGTKGAFLDSGFDFFEAINRLAYALAFYFKKLVLPVNLNVLPEIPDNPIYYAIFIAPFILGAVLVIKKKFFEAFLLSWGLLTLSPTLIILYTKMASPLAERYLYLPSVGIALLIVVMAFKLKRKNMSVMLLSAIAVFYMVTTVDRVRDWSSDLKLWEVTSKQNPLSKTALINYSSALFREGRYEDAKKEMFKILEFKDLDFYHVSRILHHIGKAEFKQGNLDRAKDFYENALKANPKSAGVYNDLGSLYYHLFDAKRKQGDRNLSYVEKAVHYYKKALKYSPHYIQPKFNLGLSLFNLKKFDESAKYFKEVILDDPQSVLAENSIKYLNSMELIRKRFKQN